MTIQHDLTVCHDILKDETYRKFADSFLNSWYKFVPRAYSKQMLPSNCWYKERFENIPNDLTKRLKSTINFYHISRQYPESQVNKILEIALNETVIFKDATDKEKLSEEVFCLPSVYIPGFPKCGTTTLYQSLTTHPNIAKTTYKEGQFWSNIVVAPNNLYTDLEVLLYTYKFKHAAETISKSNHHKLTIDGSTHTVYDSARLGDSAKDMCVIPTLLYKVMPNTKIIIMLRNPSNRQWSHYWFHCSRTKYNFGQNNNNAVRPPVPDQVIESAGEMFHNHTVAAISEFKSCIQSGASEFKCTYDASYDDEKHSFACGKTRIGVSLYYFHVIKWLSVFPREQLLFLTMEDLVQDPYSVVSSAWKFIGLDPIAEASFKPKLSNANKWITSNKYKNYFKMWSETKALLDAFFGPYNERLAKLLDDKRFLWN